MTTDHEPPSATRWWARQHALRRWQLGAALVAVFALGLVPGFVNASIIRAKNDRMFSTLTIARKNIEAERARVRDLEERLDDAELTAATAKTDAEVAAQSLVSAQKAEVDSRAAALQAKEAELAAREQAVGIRQQEIDATSFGPGVHRVGHDIQPGRYRADHTGGRSCYWAKLRENDSIIQNHLQREPGVVNVTIEPSVYKFETSGCGTWVRVP